MIRGRHSGLVDVRSIEGAIALQSRRPTMELTGGALARLKAITPAGCEARLHKGAFATPICRSPFSERLFSSTYQSHKTSFK
jgi:hypothetical protein